MSISTYTFMACPSCFTYTFMLYPSYYYTYVMYQVMLKILIF